jgi:hypothetical protein
MPTTSATFDLHPPTSSSRITRKPSFIAGAVDPDLSRKSNTIAPGNMLLILSCSSLLALACGTVFYNLSQAYNDLIVNAIIQSLPVIAVLAVAGLARIVVLHRRNTRPQTARKAAQAKAANNDEIGFLPVRRTMPSVQRRAVSRSGFQTA